MTHQASIGMKAYSFTLGHAARTDIRSFITRCSIEATDIYNKLIDVMLSKGLPIRAPIAEINKNVDFIEKKNFLSGILTHPRPLIVHEIMFIHSCILMGVTASPLVTGFGQVAKNKEVQKLMFRTRDILTKHVEVFGSILAAEHIPIMSPVEDFTTSSTAPTFSDKLIMMRASAINSQILSNYNDALLSSLRRDLQLTYTWLYAELTECSKDALNLMIKHGWLEEAPQVVDHKAIADI